MAARTLNVVICEAVSVAMRLRGGARLMSGTGWDAQTAVEGGTDGLLALKRVAKLLLGAQPGPMPVPKRCRGLSVHTRV